jgi:2-oxoglutarate dehydrogenase E1 component
MQNGAMKAWLDSSYLSGANQSWIEQLYEDFLTDPDSVDANWRSMFQQLPGTESNRINSIPKHVIISVVWRRMPHVTLLRFPTLTPMRSRLKSCSLSTLIASVVTSMRISIRWDCGSKTVWRISIRLITI